MKLALTLLSELLGSAVLLLATRYMLDLGTPQDDYRLLRTMVPRFPLWVHWYRFPEIWHQWRGQRLIDESFTTGDKPS